MEGPTKPSNSQKSVWAEGVSGWKEERSRTSPAVVIQTSEGYHGNPDQMRICSSWTCFWGSVLVVQMVDLLQLLYSIFYLLLPAGHSVNFCELTTPCKPKLLWKAEVLPLIRAWEEELSSLLLTVDLKLWESTPGWHGLPTVSSPLRMWWFVYIETSLICLLS